ncbi:hypothetical protein GYMLUDRAFT_252387 [Collybiopsis luxurians FD-317 M1]|uniref:DDE-1 domain-containing protein n=1 Tax=Collybiopsis luxurians FD-317 M1 TaxID=944289 RepID=A0A0D0C0J4_9AGAR|nr:hypothetical protein GYMLUDRAFT_252387 [Collybiopsis luxurians FD-317 M1]
MTKSSKAHSPKKGTNTIDDTTEAHLNKARQEWMQGGRHKRVTLPKKKAHGGQALLTGAEKDTLIEWVHAILKAKEKQVNEKTVSKTWIHSFLKEYDETVKLARGHGLNTRCAQAFNFPTVHHHFKLFLEVLKENGIPWENVYIQLGGGCHNSQEKFFYSRRDKMMYKQKGDSLELVTIIDCVCADGTASIKPAFVFAGTTKFAEWFEVDNNILVANSENGWTDNEIGFEWFKETFVPQAQVQNHPGKLILLIYNGHQSHT